MPTRTGGEWIVDALQAESVRHVFGIPGVHNLAIYDALIRQSEITHVLARHEAGAAFMADGYTRASGAPGVVVVTTGPGATNALTPLVESYAGSMPVLVVMSDVASPLVGRDIGALHEVPNQIECFRPVTRWAEAVTEAPAIPATVHGAFDLLRTGRPGPIAISIPNDFLTARFDAAPQGGGHGRRPPCHVDAIQEAAQLLARASTPLLIAGGGVIAAEAETELLGLSRRLGAPVITTVMGRGAVSERDPLWHGVLPNSRATEAVIRAADVILAVGCRFAHRSTQGLLLNLSFEPSQTLIHLDLDPTVIGRLFKPQLAIVGDAKDGLTRLLHDLGPGMARPGWDHRWRKGLRAAASARYTREIAHLIETLRAALPDDAIVVNDQTGINYWMEWRFPVLRPRTFLYPVGSATLGYGVPAAIGAKIARPDQAVVAVVGDGGFMYSVNELATAVKYRLPVVFLVMNDDRYGAIKWLQQAIFEGRWGEADLTNPDFPALARAFGARGERLNGVDELGGALRTALAADGPTVLELRMAVDPPWEL
ncbi:MAG TPA: thiamine pyrophosphate-binding protein [Candidatus Bathyarchaeia archaeon]|nr:thiamine pyrophosphate-binding protein [Candidatus Bathyarchaeia archaeon]